MNMKKYLYMLSVFLVAGFLSGCSLGATPKATTTEKVPVSNILKSIDGGVTWEAKDKNPDKINLASVEIVSMAFNPYDGTTSYVGTLDDGILKTNDGGENWSLLNFPAEKVYGLVIDNVDSRIIYASGVWQGRGKIFKSTNGGTDWDEIYTAPSDGPLVISLTMSKKDSNLLFATTSDKQVIKSIDAGVSWKNIYSSQSPVEKIVLDSANDNLLYLNLANGTILRSIDGGNTMDINLKDVRSGISIVEADPSHANWVYTAGRAGIFRSENAGDTWETLKTLSDSNTFPVSALAINQFNSNEIIYGAAQATYKSVDGGLNWTPFQLETKNTVNILKYSPIEMNVVYMGLRKK